MKHLFISALFLTFLSFLGCSPKQPSLQELISNREIEKKINYLPSDAYTALASNQNIPIDKIKEIFGTPSSILNGKNCKTLSYDLENALVNFFSKDNETICAVTVYCYGDEPKSPLIDLFIIGDTDNKFKLGKTTFGELSEDYNEVHFKYQGKDTYEIFHYEGPCNANQNRVFLFGGEMSLQDYMNNYVKDGEDFDYSNVNETKILPKNNTYKIFYFAFGDSDIINTF
jgi:hypothetical protein